MPKICILALIGLPAAGKTRFSQWLLQLPHKTRSFNVLTICFDNFFMSTDFSIENDYKLQRAKILNTLEIIIQFLQMEKPIPQQIQQTIQITHEDANKNFLLICDDNNYYRSMRYKLYQIAIKYNISFAQVYFQIDLNQALKRNEKRHVTERIPEGVLSQMAERLEIPNHVQNHWEYQTLVLNADQLNFCVEELLLFVQKSFKNISKVQTNESLGKEAPAPLTISHKLDLLLRRRITELLSVETNANIKKTKAKMLNDKRKQILQDIKINSIISDDNLIAYVDSLQ